MCIDYDFNKQVAPSHITYDAYIKNLFCLHTILPLVLFLCCRCCRQQLPKVGERTLDGHVNKNNWQ
jgi:hypothetical protein